MVFLFLVPPVSAENLRPMDFAKGIVLDCEEDASIYRFALPEFVYDVLTRPDFGDMRVFNRDGEDVPFSLRRPDDGQMTEHARPSFPLIMFPVYGYDQKTGGDGNVSVHIVTDSRGAVIDVKHGKGHDEGQSNKPVDFYILDLSQVEKKPDQLEFTWDRGEKDQVTRIRILGSQDLDRWTPLVASAVLADIRFGENALKQDSVELPFYESPYLKVAIIETAEPVLFTRITGHYQPSRVYDEKQRNWTRVQVNPSTESPGDYLFSVKGHFPIDRLRITFPQKNTMVRAELKSKNDTSDRWTTRYSGLVYNLTTRGLVFEKTQIPFGQVSDNTWLLSIDTKDGGMGNGLPMIDLGWLPHTMMFVARGEAPFTLAYGSVKAGVHGNPMDSILSGIKPEQEKFLVKDASMKSTIELGGRKQLERPRGPLPWRKFVLWGILLGGVGLCAGMAVSLYRQMNGPTKTE